MENQNPRVPPLWEHSLTTLLGHDPTSDPVITLRQWVHFQGIHNVLNLLSWDQEELKTIPAQQVYSFDNHGQGLYLRTNQVKQMCGLITYTKHVFGAYNSDIDPRDDPFHPFVPDEWCKVLNNVEDLLDSEPNSSIIMKDCEAFLALVAQVTQELYDNRVQLKEFEDTVQVLRLLPNCMELLLNEPVPSGPISSSRPTGYSPAAIELMGCQKGIKREIAAYPSLKDERYCDGFKRSLFIVAKSHECNEVLDPTYTPGSEAEEQELLEDK